jgi:hypothetical protein
MTARHFALNEPAAMLFIPASLPKSFYHGDISIRRQRANVEIRKSRIPNHHLPITNCKSADEPMAR